jgi:hypothetical protein
MDFAKLNGYCGVPDGHWFKTLHQISSPLKSGLRYNYSNLCLFNTEELYLKLCFAGENPELYHHELPNGLFLIRAEEFPELEIHGVVRTLSFKCFYHMLINVQLCLK